MSVQKNKAGFLVSQPGIDALNALNDMVASKEYHTESSYSANTALHTDNLISFTDKHMMYLQNHLSIDPEQYISNLKLMTRIRR